MQRWSRVRAHFDELIELTAVERETELERISATDPDLRVALESLIVGDALADKRMKRFEFGVKDVLLAQTSGAGSSPRAAPGLTGTVISHFQVLEPLGSGGMGVIYRAHDTRLQRDVALKFPLSHYAFDADVKQRFLSEARVVAALDHVNLCSVHEVGETDSGQIFLAMPLYAGETLRARLDRSAPLPIDTALEIARQVAAGLACAHAAGIVHRDLKPGNLMLLPDGTVKILDFGLAKLADGGQTHSRALLGTPGYMSPEQLRGTPIDQRADLWGMGVVLYEMLTGKGPFSGEHDFSVVHSVLHDTPDNPSASRPEISRPVEDLVLGLLEKDAGRRYVNAQQVEANIAAIQQGAPMPFKRHAFPRSIARLGRWRNTLAFTALTAFAAVMMVAFFGSRSTISPPGGPLGIRSIAARALFEQGRTAMFRTDDRRQAFGLFTAAFDEDTTFTMAAFYAAVSGATHSRDSVEKYMARAEQLSESGPEETRLLIQAYVANAYTEPRALAVAETLRARFPDNPEGAHHLATARYQAGDFLGAVHQYERAMALDSAGQRFSTVVCGICASYAGMVWAYLMVDSLPAAERAVRRLSKLKPDLPTTWALAAIVFELSDQHAAARVAREKLALLRPNDGRVALSKVESYLRTGDFEAADRLLAVVAQSEDAPIAEDALWWQVVSFRYQGRLAAALDVAARYQKLKRTRGEGAEDIIPRAIVLQENRQGAAAAILYDSLYRSVPRRGRDSQTARSQVWWLTHAGDAAASAGDTARLALLADSAQSMGTRSGYGRDVRLHHHLRGLLLRARGNLPAAEAEFRAAIFSPTFGYARSSVELANVLMDRGRAREAVPVLQAALRGGLEGSSLYVTRTELHEKLGRAWQAVGQSDSASHHYQHVLNAWRNAEPSMHKSRQRVEQRARLLAIQ